MLLLAAVEHRPQHSFRRTLCPASIRQSRSVISFFSNINLGFLFLVSARVVIPGASAKCWP